MNTRLLFISFCFIVLNACNSGSISEKELIGQWRVVKMQSELKEISPAIILEAEKEAKSSVYSLLEDNQLKMTSNFIDYGATGEWKYSEEKNELILSFENDLYKSKEIYSIESLNNNQLILQQKVKDLGSIKLTLLKEI